MSQAPDFAVQPPAEYETPRVETELSEERLAREVQYGGITTIG
jgi:hypothetical protein